MKGMNRQIIENGGKDKEYRKMGRAITMTWRKRLMAFLF